MSASARAPTRTLLIACLVIHYALGVVPAAFYGPLRHRISGLRAGRGLMYGFGLFLVNDELLAPLLGLASGPTAYPWQAHVRGLISHLVLGVVTDVGMDAVALWPWDGSGVHEAEHHGR